MIIILEGPECAGKTTLAKQLLAQMGCSIVHRSQPKTEEEKQFMMNTYVDIIENTERDTMVIFDRCWYSEMVYGKIMRDKSYISLDQMSALEEMLMHRGALIIHCTSDTSTLWSRCLTRGEDYITDVDTLHEIKCGFDHLMHEVAHLIPVVKYEYKDL